LGIPARPKPIRVVVFIDGQNLYYRCKDQFGWAWVHPLKLAQALVDEDRAKSGSDSRVLREVRFYTGIHDANKRPMEHGKMDRRLQAYRRDGVITFSVPLMYDAAGKGREKGIDVRMALDLVRMGTKGLYDVAIVVSEDSDLDEAVQDVIALRDYERWIAVENALPWKPKSGPRWLPSAARHRRITETIYNQAKDTTIY
jgi:uncharacterized LabA/DUF88 family protein